MKGLLLLAGKSKGKPMAGPPEAEEAEGGPEQEYAREAFSALQDGDEEGFVEAFLGAVRACASKAGAGGYDDEEA